MKVSPLSDVPEEIIFDLRKRYAEPQRAYHTWSHVEALLVLFSEIRDLLHDPKSVMYAILFHDAVYDPKRSDNEQKSADLVASVFPKLVDDEIRNRAVTLVLATKAHAVPNGLSPKDAEDAAIFLDMDLSILAAPVDEFEAYERNIRSEYAHVPNDAFRFGRAAILRNFLSRDRLYLSAWGQQRFDKAARQNLERSIRDLE